MAERPLYTLYKNLKAQNYDVPNDYNKFESALTRDGKSGADNRHAIYENLKAQNFDVPDTYERFYTALFEPRSKTSSRAKGGSVPMSAADRARFLSGAAAISASAKQIANNAGRYNRLKQRKQKQQKDFGRVNLGTHLTPFGGDANDVVKDEFAYNPETGKAGAYVTSDNENAYTQSDAEQRQAILDKYGEEWNKAVDMGMVPSELDKADPDMSDTDVAMRQMERRQEWLDENQNRRSQELNESMHLQDSPFVASGGAVAPSSFNAAIGNEANRLSDAEYGAYNTAKAYNQMLRTTLLQELKEQKQRNENAGWWKDKWNDVSNYFGAMFNTMLDPKLYSQGVMDAAIASNLRQVKKGMEDGTIKKGSNAGNAAQVMLSAIQQQQGEAAKQQQYGTKAYQYGDVSGRSLKFMGDFALSGWRDVMTTGFTKAGEKVGEKMALGALGKWFTKNTGRVLGDMAGSAALAATNQLGSTYNNVIERYVGMNNENGGVTQDKDGDLSFNKGVSLGKAIKDGFGSATIENFSEMFGEYLPGASKLLSKLGLSKVSSFFEKIGNNAYYKWLSNATNKSGIQGVMAEISEEEFGTALHAAWGDGDGSWSDFNVFTNPDAREKQIDTCLGMFYSVGFMQSPRTAVGAINAVKYFNIKHQVSKADKFGQMVFNDKWDEIKNKIDVTTNADLTKTVLDATRSDSMTAKQKGAVINYAMFLSKLRGFNQASDAKTKDKVEEGETAPTLSNDLDDAYTEGHNADDADKHDIQIQHEDQAKTLAAALNISEQQLSGMSDEELESLTGQDDKLDQAIYDYQLSTARYQGVVDDAQDKVDLAAHQAEQRVNMYTDQSRGSVRNATIKASGGAEDYGVYIISGNIATHEDGSIDVSNSDDMILYFDPTTNSVEHADALMFAELGEELPADAVKAQAVADAKENAIKEVAGIIDGTVDVGSQFSVTDADGTEHTYEVLADNGDGTAMITIDGNVPTELVKGENVQIPYSFEDLQKMKDLEDQKRLEAAKTEREQMEKERDAQETEQTEESQPSFDFGQILNDNGNVVLVDVLGKDGNTKYPGSKLFLIRDAGAKAKVVELKSDGTLVPHAVNKKDVATISTMSLDEYKQAMPSSSMIEDNSGENRGEIEVETPTIEGEAAGSAEETAAPESAEDSATEQTPNAEQTPVITLEDGTIVPMLEDGNPDFSKLSAAQTAELYDTQFDEDADGIVSGYVSDAKKALDKANNMTVKGKTFVEQKAAKAAKEKAIADAQAAYDSAVAIRDAYNERQLAKEENTLEGRKSLIEKAKRKYARLKNSEEWSERSGDLWNETVGKLLHRLYDATGIDVFNDTPNTVYEYVAENVGPYSLNYEGNDNSKGVQQETGLSRSDFAKLGWLAAEGKGMTIDAKVHRLWENRPSNLESSDTQEIRNALISLITSGQTAFQARDYILNHRIELAESALEEQLRQEEDAAEAQRVKEEEEKKKAELEKKKAEEEKTNENRNAPELSHEQQKAKEEGEKLGFPAVDKEGEPINQNVIELANWAKEQGLEIDPTSKLNSYADLYVMCKDGFGVSTLVPDVGEDINQVFYFPENVQGEQLAKLQEEFNVGRDLKHSADMNSELTEGVMFYDGDTAREFKEFVDKKVEMQNKVFGEQRPEEDLPFSAKDNGQQQTTSERAADVEKNKVDDMKVVDNIVGQKTRKAFERLAKMMGAEIQWQYSDKLGNGWIRETTDADGNVHRTIFITLDSSITEGAQFIFGHEMTHQIKNLNPAAYNELTQLVLDTYGSDAFDKAVDETTKRYSDAGFSGRNRDYYAEEVVADSVGVMIRDLNLAHTLAMKMSHPLLAAIHEILQKIKLAFYGTEYSDVTKNIIRSIEQAYVKTAKGRVENSETGEDVSFSLRQKPEPKKKGVGYKVFVLKDGKLYPPMVANPDGAATPVGVWLDADAAPIAGESKTGRPQVKQGGKGTQGGSGKLAYRPGWHLGVVPYAIQFNRKNAEGNKTLFPKNFVFAEVEYAADVDYQEEARQEGINPSGKYQHSLAGLKHLPTDGYYMYRTNPNPETDPWVITGAMKVNRILTRAEQADLVSKAGREPQQIQEGDIVTDDVVNSINQEIADAPKFSLKVYHGSGADFTEFDFDHMSEGAGSQVFGWGGYVTSSEKIGKSYAKIGQMSAEDRHRHASSEDTPIEAAVGSILGQEIYNERAKTFEQKKAQAIKNAENSIASYSDMLKNSNELDEKSKKFLEKSIERYKKELEVLRALTEEQYKEEYIKQGRAKNLYEVDIPDDNGSNYLDWENPLNEEQINAIRDALAKNGVDVSSWENRGFKLDLPFKDVYAAVLPMMMRCEPKEVSKVLSSLGFTGIKYPAGTIQGGAEEGDTNYVIFKPEDMKITEHTKFSIKTYHGSQASFDHFDHSFMGSGEGAQAYGWGTYVSEVEGIAKAYAKQNAVKHAGVSDKSVLQVRYDAENSRLHTLKLHRKSIKDVLMLKKKNLDRKQSLIAEEENDLPKLIKTYGENSDIVKDSREFISKLKSFVDNLNYGIAEYEEKKKENDKAITEREQVLKDLDAKMKEAHDLPERNLYSVDIPDDTGDNYIGWDEPITPKMLEAKRRVMEEDGYTMYDSDRNYDYFEKTENGKYQYWQLWNRQKGNGLYNELSKVLHSDKLASLALNKQGIVGVKVIANRNTGGNKEGKMNYVIFDENNAQITNHTKFSLRLKSAIEETETNPSDAQKESGNYKKGHIKFGGYDYTIENPKGSTRSGKDADGKEWKITMHDTYGYIRGKFGKDGDHLDMFINDKADLDNWNGDVFVVDQVNPDGSFDEHKVMYGYDSMDDAEKAYLANYSDGWQGLGNITGASKDEFDKWLDTSNRKLKPFADYAKVKFSQAQSVSEPRYSLKDIKPIGVGAFGNIYNQFRGKSKAAIEFLKKLGSGEATAALHHHTIGDISLVWGDKKAGLDKILRKHPEVVDNLQSIIDSMEVVQESDNRVKLESPTHFAVVSKEYKGEPREQWLLTAYEKRESLENDKSMDTATSSLGGDTALSQSKGSAAKIDNSSETAKENGEKFSLKDEKTLAGVHNITEEKLRKALKLGGLANPSLAVIDTSKSAHDNFGEISFIAPSDLVDKRTGKTGGTWITDAYTQRYPSVERQMSEKGSQKFRDWVDSLEYPAADKAEIKKQAEEALSNNNAPAWELMYLKEKGIDIKEYNSKVDYRWKEIIRDHPTAEDILSSMQNDPELNEKVTSLVKHTIIHPTWEKVSLEVRRKIYEETGTKVGPINPQVRKQTKEIFERDYAPTLLDKNGKPKAEDIKKVVEDIVKEHNDTKKYDFYLSKVKASGYVNKNGLYEDYIRWQEKKLDEFGTKNRIFRGYKPDGTRKYVPETLENVSKAMREEAGGQTNGSEYTSFGSFIAKIASRVDSTDEMRANKDKLSSNEDKTEFYEKWSEVYYELAKFLYNDVFYGENRLHDIVLQSDPKKYAKKEYGITLTPSFMKKLDALKNAVRTELKSAYFETKYNRPLRLNEFAAAVVPDNLGEDVRKGIEDAGLPMYNYDPNKEGDRSRAFNEAINSSDNIRFSLAGERGAADMAEDLKSLNTPDEVDDAIKTAIDEMPSGWKMANRKMIHIAQALGENRKAEIAGEEPKFSLKDGSLIKAGTYFSGGGLVEEGLKGIIDPVVAVEYDEKISGVYRNNFGQHIVTADVRDVDPKELVKQIDGEVEYFHASPVCKNYSQAKSNHAELELDKETAASTAEFINAIKPKVVTIENVKGYKDSEAMKTITDALDANGYTWDADVYNAADYGGYTNRERLIVRAVRDGQLPEKPKKMARKSGWYEAVADIIPTLTEKKNGVAPWMDIRLKADGIDWRHIDKPLYVMGSAYADGKIPHAFADELLPTLRTKSGDVIVMPDGKVYRAMGRVLARVSGVSDDYKMPFSENLSHTIIGNGIPTQLTEHVIVPLLQNTLRPTTLEDGNTKFSLRYDKFEHDLNQWKKDNNLPKDAKRPTIPQRNVGESAVDFLKRVDEYRKQMALWKTAPTYEQHLLSDDTALGEFNRELQRGSVLKRIAFQDSMLAIRKAQEAIMKEVGVDRLNMAEDTYTAENRSHGKGKNEFEEYNNEFLQPLRKAYHQMKKVLGDSYDNVRLYMMAKHGLERDAQMAFKKSLEADYEDVAQRSAAYKAYKGDINRMGNDSGFELGLIDYATWVRTDNAIKMKYSPSYMKYRYDKMGIAFDYSGLSALFDGSDFEEAAHKLVRDIESKHIVETKELWDATNAATKKILRDGYKAGMMSKDTYQYVRDMYSHYIPLRGWDGTTADQVWDYVGGGKGAFNQTLKTAHGRTSIADDPIAYIENMAESGILLNNKNWVKQHLMLLAQNHPTSLLTLSKAWYVKSTDANGNEEWIPATPQITSQMNSNQVKAAIDAFEQKMEQMEQTGDATQKRDGLNIAFPQTHSEEREHEVRVMKDGEEYVIYVNGDPQLAQAMNNTRAHRVREIQSGKLDRAAAWLGRKMAAAYTSLSPLFIPSNYFRDLTMTLASTAIREDGRYNYLLRKNMATSWNLGFMLKDYQNGKLRDKVNNGNATPKEQMFYDFMMNGGETGFVSSLDVEDLKKKFKNDLKDLDRWKANPVKVGHTIMDSIEFLNRMVEDSNRFAVYMTSIQYGRSIDEAVNDAKDVTLNFNRKGTGEYGWQMIRNLYLFINPAVQSLQTLGALAKHHPFKFTAVTASWLASGVLVPIVNAALMSLLGGDDDKDKYWQFTKWDRRNNLIMWVPFTHEYVKIPLAQEFRAFYGVGDMIASKMMGGKLAEESWSQYAEDLLGQVVDMLPLDPTGYDGNIAVSLMPNAIRPVFELAFNVDFTGKPLFKDTEYNKYDPNFTKAYVGTPDWLVRVSKMVNSIGNDYPDVQQNSIDAFGDPRYNLNNPGVVDHILSSYLGGAYTMGSQVLGLLTKSLNDPKEIKVADIPLFSKFVSNPDDRPVSKKQGDEFWDKKEYYDRASNTISKLKKQAKIDGDYSLLERFYGSEEYKTYKLYEKDVKDYKETRKKERAEESGDEYKPHQINAEDIYNNHTTSMDEFEDMKLKQLYTKLNGFKSTYDLLVDTAPSQSDGYYNANKTAIDAIDEISLDKQEISELKKGFLDDGKDAYNAEDMKQIRELRKKVLAVLEKANKVVVANQKAKKK
jgi:site-specific DNA-cytosine methylase